MKCFDLFYCIQPFDVCNYGAKNGIVFHVPENIRTYQKITEFSFVNHSISGIYINIILAFSEFLKIATYCLMIYILYICNSIYAIAC